MEQKMKVQYDEGAVELKREHSTDAAYDLHAAVETWIPALSRTKVRTGIHIQLPHDMCALVFARSGMSLKGINGTFKGGERRHNCDVMLGLIDSGYTGEICVMMNNQDYDFFIPQGAPIGQMLLVKCEHPELIPVDSLDATDRGEQGFKS